MLIIALVLAVVGLAALVTAVVTSNELIAWVCIAASVIGVLLLIVDALRERKSGHRADDGERADADADDAGFDAEYPDDDTTAVETDHPETDTDTTAVPVESRDDEVSGEDRR
jgi:hypothetical protein